jgi:hypothetical protein
VWPLCGVAVKKSLCSKNGLIVRSMPTNWLSRPKLDGIKLRLVDNQQIPRKLGANRTSAIGAASCQELLEDVWLPQVVVGGDDSWQDPEEWSRSAEFGPLSGAVGIEERSQRTPPCYSYQGVKLSGIPSRFSGHSRQRMRLEEIGGFLALPENCVFGNPVGVGVFDADEMQASFAGAVEWLDRGDHTSPIPDLGKHSDPGGFEMRITSSWRPDGPWKHSPTSARPPETFPSPPFCTGGTC